MSLDSRLGPHQAIIQQKTDPSDFPKKTGIESMFLLLFSLCVFGKLLPGLARDIAAKNQKLLTQEIESLNSSQSHLKPLILTIPAGDWFIQGPLVFDNVINMQIHLEGNILFLDNYDTFPLIDGAYQDLWSFNNSHFVSFIGKGGIIDGNGFEWWKQRFLKFISQSYFILVYLELPMNQA